MLRNIVDCDFFINIVKDEADGFVDDGTPDRYAILLTHFPSPTFQFFLLPGNQPYR